MGVRARTKERAHDVLCVLVGIALAMGALVLPSQAHAAETAKLTVGASIYYGGYTTNWMWADGEVAYCGNPSASTPASGTYPKSALSAPSGRTAEAAADLWFGYGAPASTPPCGRIGGTTGRR